MWDWLARVYDKFLAKSEEKYFLQWRKNILTDVAGKACLEIGAGTGSSIGCWPANLERLVLLEPSTAMRRQLLEKVAAGKKAGAPVFPREPEILDCGIGGVNSLPFEDNTFDVVLVSLVLCGVPSTRDALTEIRRVLKEGGTLRFIEHVRPQYWVHHFVALIISPIWKLVFCCSILRDTDDHIKEVFDEVDHKVHVAPPFMRHVYGEATARKSQRSQNTS